MNIQGELKVKTFYQFSPEDVEEDINEWLEENHVEIKQIDWTAASYDPTSPDIMDSPNKKVEYSCMIFYVI